MSGKSESFYYIPDNQRVMLELIQCIPASWMWASGQLKPPYNPDSSANFSFVTMPFAELREDLMRFVGKGYRGGIEVRHSAYRGKMHLSRATVRLELASWIGTAWPEFGHQPARIRVGYRQMVDPKPAHLMGEEFRPEIDRTNSGSWEDIGPIVRTCQKLGLRQYSLPGDGSYTNPWRPSEASQAAE